MSKVRVTQGVPQVTFILHTYHHSSFNPRQYLASIVDLEFLLKKKAPKERQNHEKREMTILYIKNKMFYTSTEPLYQNTSAFLSPTKWDVAVLNHFARWSISASCAHKIFTYIKSCPVDLLLSGEGANVTSSSAISPQKFATGSVTTACRISPGWPEPSAPPGSSFTWIWTVS